MPLAGADGAAGGWRQLGVVWRVSMQPAVSDPGWEMAIDCREVALAGPLAEAVTKPKGAGAEAETETVKEAEV